MVIVQGVLESSLIVLHKDRVRFRVKVRGRGRSF